MLGEWPSFLFLSFRPPLQSGGRTFDRVHQRELVGFFCFICANFLFTQMASCSSIPITSRTGRCLAMSWPLSATAAKTWTSWASHSGKTCTWPRRRSSRPNRPISGLLLDCRSVYVFQWFMFGRRTPNPVLQRRVEEVGGHIVCLPHLTAVFSKLPDSVIELVRAAFQPRLIVAFTSWATL